MKDPTAALARIVRALAGAGPRSKKLQEVVEILRGAGRYRVVEISEVTSSRSAEVVASSGRVGPLDRPSSPLEFLRTASAMRVPVLDSVRGEPRGAIDVESDGGSLDDEDLAFLEHCAAEVGAALSASPG